MTSARVAITTALSSQVELQGRREHCGMDPQLLATIGCTVGQQVRIRRNEDEYALYTVSETRPEHPDTIVRIGLTGRQRLGTSAEFDGVVDVRVPDPTLAEDVAEATSEFIERLDDNGRQRGLIAIAPHGGDIERHTDQQAERVAAHLEVKAVSSWRCKGWKRGGGAFERWHITSTDINEASFPRLAAVMSRGFTYAVAFHGFDRDEILVGGAAPEDLKCEIRDAIERATAGSGVVVRVARPDEGFGGDDPLNIVNRLTAGGLNGIQIEQGLEARSTYWAAIADAVADIYRSKLSRRPPAHWQHRMREILAWIRDALRRPKGQDVRQPR